MAVIQARRSQAGKTKYRALVRMKGYQPQSATFDRKTDAKKWAQDTESDIRNNRHFTKAEAKKHTVADLIDLYQQHIRAANPKGAEIVEALGHKSLQMEKLHRPTFPNLTLQSSWNKWAAISLSRPHPKSSPAERCFLAEPWHAKNQTRRWQYNL